MFIAGNNKGTGAVGPSGKDKERHVLKVDPSTGLVEFPEPGDTKKHLLPVFVDPDETVAVTQKEIVKEDNGPDKKEFWMPDKFCKVCYGCEDAFTMYRRRHHCRMCGQVFCNQCSSFYIDGSLINLSGPVRACRLCHDQLLERNNPQSSKPATQRRVRETIEELSTKQMDALGQPTRFGFIHETPTMKIFHTNNLQKRASDHLDALVSRLVSNCDVIQDSALWSSIIVHLVREVVSSVDPNVRAGDSLDIRPYVKIKTIPGGSIDENCYINGVVFRKNVSHKKMAADGNKVNPRILLLSGSIDFQRTDNRLASMDTLIEQEDKYIELLIDKIMSLKPDIILVGKAVARRAQELLCSHNVVVMQNVKPQLLERISRMTGAIMLQSTDHMIQQYGEECLGTCGQFKLRLVQDNPEKSHANTTNNSNRVLRTRILRGSTYAYFQGCPSERGCTLVLRGDERPVLAQVKKIIGFSVMLAYHLRLEVAYYNDRFAQLPNVVDTISNCEDSDVEDEESQKLSKELRSSINRWYCRKSTISINGVLTDSVVEGSPTSEGNDSRDEQQIIRQEHAHREARQLLSSSLDVDFGLAYNNEIRGMPHHVSKSQLLKVSCLEHQTLLVTSLLMGDGNQKSKPEVKGIRFYTPQDVALGQFLIENCFQLHKVAVRESSMIDNILSFAHRGSRLDITVRKVGNTSSVQFEDGMFVARDPMNLPILMHSYCKECQQVVTPEVVMSDETWKISFGKFMEICFYNRSALGRTNNCQHCVHESHSLIFSCEGYEAKFDIVPLHPYSLHVRTNMGEFPTDQHAFHAATLLTQLPVNIIEMVDVFLRTIITLENIARDVMVQRLDDLQYVCSDFRDLEAEIKTATNSLIEEICKAAEWLSAHGGNRVLGAVFPSKRSSLRGLPTSPSMSLSAISPPPDILDSSKVLKLQSGSSVEELSPVSDEDIVRANTEVRLSEVMAALTEEPPDTDNTSGKTGGSSVKSSDLDSVVTSPSAFASSVSGTPAIGAVDESSVSVVHDSISDAAAVVAVPASAISTSEHAKFNFPMYYKREAYLKARHWNLKLETIYRFIEQVRQEMLLALQQQQTGAPMPNLAALQIAPLHGIAESAAEHDADDDDEDNGHVGSSRSSHSLTRRVTSPSSSLPPAPALTPTSSPSRPTREDSNSSSAADSAVVENLPPAVQKQASTVTLEAMSGLSPPKSETMSVSFAGNTPRDDKSDDDRDSNLGVDETGTDGIIGTERLASNSSSGSGGARPIAASASTVAEMAPGIQSSVSSVGARSSVPVDGGDNLDGTGKESLGGSSAHAGKGKVRPMSTRSMPSMPVPPDVSSSVTSSSATAAASKGGPKVAGYRLPKALARLVLGKDADNEDARPKSIVPLGVMEEGRLGLRPGRHGEVVAVHEDEPATIIAYSLASEEYFRELQKFFVAGTDADGGDQPGSSYYNDGLQSAGMMDEAAKASLAGNYSQAGANKDNADKDDLYADYQPEVDTTSHKQVGQAFSGANNEGGEGDYNANFNSFSSVFGHGNPHAPEAVAHDSANVTGATAAETILPGIAGVPSSVSMPGIAHATSSIGVLVGTATVTGSNPSSGHNSANASTSRSANELERQMTSQRKLHARHTFEDIDDKGHVLCKFICTSYWAGQFEAIRAGYLKEEENVGFIKSLSMSSRWGAQGGKSGANFSKSLDERFVLKVISKVELQMFLDFAPAYFGK
jgi:hypothetical protein